MSCCFEYLVKSFFEEVRSVPVIGLLTMTTNVWVKAAEQDHGVLSVVAGSPLLSVVESVDPSCLPRSPVYIILAC